MIEYITGFSLISHLECFIQKKKKKQQLTSLLQILFELLFLIINMFLIYLN